MSDRKDEVIEEINAAKSDEEKIEQIKKDDKERQEAEIISEGERADRLVENTDFLYFMKKLTNRAEEITNLQNSRLLNIRKIADDSRTIDSIVGNQIREAVTGGEFLGLRQMSQNIKSAIKNKASILEQMKDDE